MKGIILAGGHGTRLYPLTRAVSKQLLPVFDKPMVYYPLSLLMLAGIRDILVITTPTDAPLFARLLGDGAPWGLKLSYVVQPKPEGIAQAFLLAEEFLGGDSACLTLGDNFLHGVGLSGRLQAAAAQESGATIFGSWVRHPEHYGVAVFDAGGQLADVEEKPKVPRSQYAVIGLYFYDSSVVDIARALRPSARGELEITDVNREYIKRGAMRFERLNRGMAWLDMGTPSSLLEAAHYVETLELRQGLKIGCLEEIAWRQGFIDDAALAGLARDLAATSYGEYLASLLG
jgi:glucose-1-phosphate thymidylyltransferase